MTTLLLILFLLPEADEAAIGLGGSISTIWNVYRYLIVCGIDCLLCLLNIFSIGFSFYLIRLFD